MSNATINKKLTVGCSEETLRLIEATRGYSINNSALENQVSGNHYKDMPIQVVQFCHANQIPYMEGNVIKYMCRWKKKNGIQDLEKANWIDSR